MNTRLRTKYKYFFIEPNTIRTKLFIEYHGKQYTHYIDKVSVPSFWTDKLSAKDYLKQLGHYKPVIEGNDIVIKFYPNKYDIYYENYEPYVVAYLPIDNKQTKL